MSFTAEDYGVLAKIASLATWEFAADVVDVCDATLGRLSTADDTEAVAAALRAGARIYGRLGEVEAVQRLIAQFSGFIATDVEYDLYRYLLNAAAVRGNTVLATETFDRVVSLGDLTGAVFGAYLRAIWIAQKEPHQMMAAMRAVAEEHGEVPYPVGLEIVIADPADEQLVSAIAAAICRPSEVVLFRNAIRDQDIDEALRVLMSAGEGFGPVQQTVSDLLVLLGKDQRADELFAAVARFDVLGIGLGPRCVANLYRTVTSWRNEEVLALAEERAIAIRLDRYVIGSAITAYAAMNLPGKVLEVIELAVRRDLLSADGYGKAVHTCFRYRLTAAAVTLIERDPVGAAESQVPVLLQQALHGLIRSNSPDDAIGLVRTCLERSVPIPPRAWKELVVGLAGFNHPETAAILLTSAMNGVVFGRAVLDSVVRTLVADPNVTSSTLFGVIDILSRAGLDVSKISSPVEFRSLPDREAHVVRRAFGSLADKASPTMVAVLLIVDLAINADREPELLDVAIKDALALRVVTEPLIGVLGDQVRKVGVPEPSLKDRICVRGELLGRLRLTGDLQQMRQVFDQSIRLIDEYKAERHALDLPHALVVGFWDVMIRAYIGHDAGPKQAPRLVAAALERDIDLDYHQVRAAIRACGTHLKPAGFIYRTVQRYKNKKDQEARKTWLGVQVLLERELALIAAIDRQANETALDARSKALWYLASPETRADQGNRGERVAWLQHSERRANDTDWWTRYLLVLVLTTSEKFADAWREFSRLYKVDINAGKSVRQARKHNPETWSARAVHTALHGALDLDTNGMPGNADPAAAIKLMHENVLVDDNYEPLEWIFEALLEAEWSSSPERSVAWFRNGIAADLVSVAAWTQARVAMAVEQGRSDVTSDVLQHMARVAPGLDEQALWTDHARAGAAAGTPSAFADVNLTLSRMSDAGLTPTAGTLVRLIDAGRQAGARDLLAGVASLANDPIQGAHLTESVKSDLAERLVVGFVEVGMNNEAIGLANSVINSGRALSLAAKTAVRRAQFATGIAPGDDFADPRETLKVLALFAADLVHDVGTPGEFIANYHRAAQFALDTGKLDRLGERLDDIDRSLNELFKRLEPLRQFGAMLQTGAASGNLDATVGLRSFLNDFVAQDRTVTDLKGVRIDIHFERSIARNNAYEVRAPALLIDTAVKNLVRNAGQALVDAGTPDPRITILVRDTIEPSIGFPSGFVALSVIDNGPGLPSRVRETVLSGGAPTRGIEGSGGGVGMGLVLVHTIATILEAGFQILEHGDGTTIEMRLHPRQEGNQ